METMAKTFFRPTFLMIPTRLMEDKQLQNADLFIFATIYWFHNLKDGKCYASNKAIGDIAGVHARTVGKSLTRLEERGYIARRMSDSGREAIVPVAQMGEGDGHSVPITHGPQTEGGSPTGRQNNNIKKEYINNNIYTLPLQGKSPTERVYNFYSEVFRQHYGFVPKHVNYPKEASVIKSMLKTYTEPQLGMLILMHFDWHGSAGDSDFEHKKLADKCFPLSWVSPNSNAYYAYLTNTLGIDMEDNNELIATITDKLKSYEQTKSS